MRIAADTRPCHVYGLFVRGECIYVGQTRDLRGRRKAHDIRFGKLLGKRPELRVFDTAINGEGDEIERAAILKWKSSGQAKYNKRLTVKTAKQESQLYWGTEIHCKETDEHEGLHFADMGWLTEKQYEQIYRSEPQNAPSVEDTVGKRLKKGNKVWSWIRSLSQDELFALYDASHSAVET